MGLNAQKINILLVRRLIYYESITSLKIFSNEKQQQGNW
jgi:hypothetical protein